MKNMIKLPAIVLGLMLLFAGTTEKAMAQQEDVSLQSFYDELSPYGQWIKDPQYGYVWRPDVDQDEFRPYYTNGRWVMTEYGNTWVSNYDWGWAPFHYGRWVYNRYNDWVWIPDTVWGPAWVTWRSGGGYYGWAPLGPSISIGINIGRGGYRIPDMCWNFIPYNNIYYSSYPRYYSNRNRVYIQKTVIINNVYVRNNRTYYTGPRADEIRRRTNQRVDVYEINRSNRPGASRVDNKSVNIYSPRPSRGESNVNAAPRNAVQGNINRGPVGREQNTRVDARANAGRNDVDNRNIDSRPNMNESTNRPSRGNNVGTPVDRNVDRGQMSTGRENSRPPVVQRNERNNDSMNPSTRSNRGQEANQSSVQQRTERNREIPVQQARPQIEPRAERNREVPVQRAQPVERRAERQQAPAQRAERQQRVERPQPQRVERSSSAPQRSNGKAAESRGNARPGRGGN